MSRTDLVRAAGGITKFIETYASDLGSVAPSHVDVAAFVGLAAAYVRSDPTLRRVAEQNPGSLIIALRECAALGHMPMKGIVSLVPFKGQVQLIEEVRGVKERMYRAGGVLDIHAQVVREKDSFVYRPDRVPDHTFDPFASNEERGPLMGVYAWAPLITGGTEWVWLNRHDIARYRAMSAAVRAGKLDFWGPPWPDEGPHTFRMWLKTALHRLADLVPMSSEYRWQLNASEAAGRARFASIPEAATRPVVPDGGEDIHDAEIVDETGAQATETWPEVTQPGGKQ